MQQKLLEQLNLDQQGRGQALTTAMQYVCRNGRGDEGEGEI